jgi:hypothetical protein
MTQSVQRGVTTRNQLSKDPFALVREDKIDIDELNGLPTPRFVPEFFYSLNRSWREKRVAADDLCLLDGPCVIDGGLYFNRAFYFHLSGESGIRR